MKCRDNDAKVNWLSTVQIRKLLCTRLSNCSITVFMIFTSNLYVIGFIVIHLNKVTHVLVEPASGIRQHESLNTKQFHHTNGDDARLGRVALVQVKSALHANDLMSVQITKDETTLMSLHC